ncbi:cellulose biosynthesis protein BcsQ [Hylemonella gracilis]|uniref:cellulose biosynthesis protein BcsQ n=1 Tax=Hylemonella gracilis TaxID=80880 RepID=UPI00111085D6|nr:cellulose biosynthesis protein BcsQ [Hylemonella gracilis]
MSQESGQHVRLVAVMGATGGAGATTVAAHLACALALQKRPVLAIDLSPANALRLFYGMEWAEEQGWARQLLAEQAWHDAAWRDSQGRAFVPFGALRDDAATERLAQTLRAHPRWLRDRLEETELDPGTIVVCDCPIAAAALRDQALTAADLALLVCAPDTLSYAQATRRIERGWEGAVGMPGAPDTGRPPETAIVLNGHDPARLLDRDIALLLRTGYKSVFAPTLVHRDESLREALACKQTVFDVAPASQAAHDCAALATWTLARLGQIEARAAGRPLPAAPANWPDLGRPE